MSRHSLAVWSCPHVVQWCLYLQEPGSMHAPWFQLIQICWLAAGGVCLAVVLGLLVAGKSAEEVASGAKAHSLDR